MNDREVAVEAIAEGYHILWLLCKVDKEKYWMTDSVPVVKLDRLATELGFHDARSLCFAVEHNGE